MRISGGFAPKSSPPGTPQEIEPSVRGRRQPRRRPTAYVLAAAWVVVALVLYAVQVLNLIVA